MSKDLKAELAQKLMDMDVNTFRMAPVKVCVAPHILGFCKIMNKCCIMKVELAFPTTAFICV